MTPALTLLARLGGAEVGTSIVLSLFVLIDNPLIVMAIMGFSLGHVGNSALGPTTLVGLITIALSSCMILYSHHLYVRLAPWLGLFERRHPFRELAVEHAQRDTTRPDVVIFGLSRYGGRLAHALTRQNFTCWKWTSTPKWCGHSSIME